ncbi:MAG: hypothetical protein AB8H03_28280 [Saprospiraceae bacterium]
MENIPPPNVFLSPKEETPIKGIFIYSIIVAVAIIVLANIYAQMNIFVPILVVRVMLPFAYCMLIGYFMSWGFFLGKVSGFKNLILLVLIGTIFSTYFLWAIWTATKLGEPMFNRVGNLFEGLNKINIQGVLIKGEIVGGAILAKIVWVLETILIFLVPIFVFDEKPPKLSTLFSKDKTA